MWHRTLAKTFKKKMLVKSKS